jgi:hypothetical protein
MKHVLLGEDVEVITEPQAGRSFTVNVCRGRDGALVVNLDTGNLGESDQAEGAVPKMRVYVNDDVVWEEAAPYFHPEDEEAEA